MAREPRVLRFHVRIRVKCPHCDREFDVNAPIMPVGSGVSKGTPSQVPHSQVPQQYSAQPPTTPTHRGIASVNVPIVERASKCAMCGLTVSLHEGEDNLAWARYGCDSFLPRRDDE
jgi:hypothetical protein